MIQVSRAVGSPRVFKLKSLVSLYAIHPMMLYYNTELILHMSVLYDPVHVEGMHGVTQ